ncbi:MAG: hypothetical protein R2731_13305 [Nocardioides sp.]
MTDLLLRARAAVLHDLTVAGAADAAAVSVLEDAVAQRRWWLEQWADGAPYIAGLVAQDVQDTLFDARGRWPVCAQCDLDEPAHSLHIEPDIGGPDPHWVCSETGLVVAALGRLAPPG